MKIEVQVHVEVTIADALLWLPDGKPREGILCGQLGCSNLLFELPSLIVYTPGMSRIPCEGIEETGSSERPRSLIEASRVRRWS